MVISCQRLNLKWDGRWRRVWKFSFDTGCLLEIFFSEKGLFFFSSRRLSARRGFLNLFPWESRSNFYFSNPHLLLIINSSPLKSWYPPFKNGNSFQMGWVDEELFLYCTTTVPVCIASISVSWKALLNFGGFLHTSFVDKYTCLIIIALYSISLRDRSTNSTSPEKGNSWSFVVDPPTPPQKETDCSLKC